MIIDCISDLHGHYPKLDGGDLLIVAGDLTARDTHKEYLQFFCWLHNQRYKHYIFIAGNHDNLIQKGEIPIESLGNTSYLCDSGTEFEGLKIWGSPWTKTFPDWNSDYKAFGLHTEEELAQKWALIPDNTNILITHSPPRAILDYTELQDGTLYYMGSQSLEDKLFYNIRSNLDLHVFGHIHECGGQKQRTHSCTDKYTSVNASHVNEHYQPVNKPIRIIL